MSLRKPVPDRHVEIDGAYWKGLPIGMHSRYRATEIDGAMRCSEVMKLRIECLSAADSVLAAARRMREHQIAFLPVCDVQRKVLGTVTDRAITTRVVAGGLPASTSVADIMATDLVACRADDDIRTAERVMAENHETCILILDELGRLSGLLSLSDLARFEEPSRLAKTLRDIAERAGET